MDVERCLAVAARKTQAIGFLGAPDATVAILALREATEKTVLVPLRARRIVGDSFQQLLDNHVELRRSGLVYGLIQVVRRGVISILQPLLVDLFFGRAERIAEFECQRRNAVLNNAVLIATNE